MMEVFDAEGSNSSDQVRNINHVHTESLQI